jgi:aspartate carbamoyltransferase
MTLSLLRLTTTKNISHYLLDRFLSRAVEMAHTKNYTNKHAGKILGLLFYEPSTRTSCSFQAAMLKLGGSCIVVNDSYSSAKKGESLEDTIRTMELYCDALVLRHPLKGSSQLAAKYTNKPIINAGDGDGEHPTQALLDVYTIYKEFSRLGNMTVTFMGDLKYSRTIHSLARLLALYKNTRFIYVSPAGLEMPQDLQMELIDLGVEQITIQNLEEAIQQTDVLYVTRIQKERMTEEQHAGLINARTLTQYTVTPEIMNLAKAKMAVMHPLPRNEEIHPDVDNDPRAAYFRQMENGLEMRIAILDILFESSA